MNVHPLAAIMGQIEKAKNEMELVRKVLNDVRAQGGTNPDFRENRRWIPSKEVGEELGSVASLPAGQSGSELHSVRGGYGSIRQGNPTIP